MQNKRNAEIDMMKGIGIILVVLLHIGIGSYFFRVFFNMFHMAIFVFTAGYCFNENNVNKSWYVFAWKKIKGLYFPYVIFNVLLCLFHNIFIKISIYTDNAAFLEEQIGLSNYYGLNTYKSLEEILHDIKAILLFGQEGIKEQVGGATWFLIMLFWISIFYYFIEKVLYIARVKNKIIFQAIISIVLLFVGYLSPRYGITNKYALLSAASMYFVFFVGYLAKKYNVFIKIKENIEKNVFLCLVSLLILFDLCNGSQGFGIGANIYDGPIKLIIASVLGIYITMFVVLDLQRNKIIKEILALLGKGSMFIMMFHFLAFKIVTFIQIIIYKKPIYVLASFPTLYVSGRWWALYLLVGLFVPLLIYIVYNKIIYFIKYKVIKIERKV